MHVVDGSEGPTSSILRNADQTRIADIKSAILVFKALGEDYKNSEVYRKAKSNNQLLEKVDAAAASINYLEQLITDLYAAVNYAENTNHATIDYTLASLDNSIRDLSSAMVATTLYDNIWFSRLLMNDDDKSLIAGTLLRNVSRYTVNFPTAWQGMADGDLSALNAVRYPIEDNKNG